MSFAKYPVTGGGTGDVVGPVSSVNNGVVLFDGTTGKVIKDLGVGSANQVLLTNGTTPSFGAITNAYIDSGAAIALSKLAALTIDRALISNGSGVIAASSVTSTELGYLSGVTSAIQTQLNGKVGTTGNETIAGSKTFSSAVAITATTNQLILGTTNTATINASAPAASRVYTIPDAGQNASFVMDRGTQTLQGTYTFTQQTMTQNVGSTAAAWYLIQSSATNPQLYNEFQSTAQTWRVGLNVDGLNLGSYVIQDFTATITRAAITTGGQLQLPATSNQLQFGATNTVTISSTAPTASRVYTIPDAGAAADFILSAGNQTVGGSKTFSSTIVGSISGNAGTVTNGAYVNVANTFTLAQTISAASNQVILSSGVNQLTLNSGTSAAARTYTVPDTGTTDTFAMLGGAQAFTALKTFNSGLAIAGGAAANNTIWVASNILNIRGGTSGTDIYNTSGNVVVDITDAGAVTLGPTTYLTNAYHTSYSSIVGRINSGDIGNFAGINEVNLSANYYPDATGAGKAITTQASNAAALYAVRRPSSTPHEWYVNGGASTANTALGGFTSVGTISSAGAWTLGPSGGSNQTLLYGPLRLQNATAGSSPLQGILFFSSQNYYIRGGADYSNRIEVTSGSAGVSLANGGTAWAAISDVRQKKNIMDLSYGLNEIMELHPVRFDYDFDEGNSAKRIGFVAQEVLPNIPEAVSGSEETQYSLATTEFIPVMVKAIQELAAKNDELEAKLDALKAS